ncbi:MAG: O-antigen ligase family protein [Acidobacteria bacterium]|nr:O-antigen ligase family protein [Acidobacteriota bacterium]
MACRRSSMARELSRLLALAGYLPAGFWLAYAVWNTVLPAPPAFGPVTGINVFYVAMLPAAALSVVRWRRYRWPGQSAYFAFLTWVVVGLAWYDPAHGVDVVKRLLIYGLLGLTAAQMVVGTRRGAGAFTISLLVVTAALSIWTIGHAIASGFSYRGGLPINPNLPATLIGPGLLAALVLCLRREGTRGWPLILSVLLAALYACLLLGSRGVLAALVGAIVVVAWRLRPTRRRALTVALASAAVVALAQVPAVPYALVTVTQSLTQSLTRGVPQGGAPGTDAPAPTVAGSGPRAIAPNAAQSTALARFGEEGVSSFNLRRDLWEACVRELTSGPGPLLIGGGMGRSEVIAHATNPVFRSSHHAWLQVAVDFGLLGLFLLIWSQGRMVQHLLGVHGWFADLGLAIIVFWTITGLTVTATDLHVYWVGFGAVAGGASQLVRIHADTALPSGLTI